MSEQNEGELCNNKFLITLLTLNHVVFKNHVASTTVAPPPYGQVVNGNNSKEFTGRTPPPPVVMYTDTLSHNDFVFRIYIYIYSLMEPSSTVILTQLHLLLINQ